MSNSLRVLGVLLLCLGVCSCRDRSKAAAGLQVGDGGFVIENPDSERPYFYDFKHVVYGERLQHVFKLKNAEGRALTIKDMLATCGCTRPRASYVDGTGQRVEGSNEKGQVVLVVPPDTVVDVAVDIDTTLVQTMNMDKLSQVRIRTDAAANPYLMLEMHLVVVRAFRSVPARVELDDTPQSAGKSGRTDITVDVRGNASRIKGIEKVEGTFTAELQETEVNGETDWILTVTAPPGLPLGPARGTVTMRTTAADGQGEGAPFSVPVLAQVVPDVVISPLALARNDVDHVYGATLDAEVQALVPGARVRVLSVALEGERSQALRAETTPAAPDDSGSSARHALKLIVPKGTQPGVYAGKIVVAIDDPTLPQVSVPYSVTVQ